MSSVVVLTLSLVALYPHVFTTQWESDIIPPLYIEGIGLTVCPHGRDVVYIIDENDSCETAMDFSEAPSLIVTINMSASEIVLHARENHFLLMSKLPMFIALASADYASIETDFYDVSIPLMETIYFDAYMLTDWSKVPSRVRARDDWWLTVCAGLEDMIDSTVYGSVPSEHISTQQWGNFMTEYVSENWGSPSSLHYWVNRCGWFQHPPTSDHNNHSHNSKRTAQVHIAQLWHISDDIIKQAASPFIPLPDASQWPHTHSLSPHPPSSPCIMQEVHVMNWSHAGCSYERHSSDAGFIAWTWSDSSSKCGEGWPQEDSKDPCLEDLLASLQMEETTAARRGTRGVTYISAVGISHIVPIVAGPPRHGPGFGMDDEQIRHLLFVILTYQNMRATTAASYMSGGGNTSANGPGDGRSGNRNGLVIRSFQRGIVRRAEVQMLSSSSVTLSIPHTTSIETCNLEIAGVWRHVYLEMYLLQKQLKELLLTPDEVLWSDNVLAVGRTLFEAICMGQWQHNESNLCDDETSLDDINEMLHSYYRRKLRVNDLIREFIEGLIFHIVDNMSGNGGTNNSNHTCFVPHVCQSKSARDAFLTIINALCEGTDGGSATDGAVDNGSELLVVRKMRRTLQLACRETMTTCGDTAMGRASTRKPSEDTATPERSEHGWPSKQRHNHKVISLPTASFRVHVIVSVLPEDVENAERLVESFYYRVFETTVVTGLHYHIMPFPASTYTYSYRYDNYSKASPITDMHPPSLPSLRNSILFIEQIIDRFATNRDVVVVIIGIEALRGLIPPNNGGQTAYTATGIFKYVLDLPNNISYVPELVFAKGVSSCRDICDRGGDDCDIGEDDSKDMSAGAATLIDLRAFLGMAYEVWNVIDAVWAHSLQRYSDNALAGVIMDVISWNDQMGFEYDIAMENTGDADNATNVNGDGRTGGCLFTPGTDIGDGVDARDWYENDSKPTSTTINLAKGGWSFTDNAFEFFDMSFASKGSTAAEKMYINEQNFKRKNVTNSVLEAQYAGNSELALPALREMLLSCEILPILFSHLESMEAVGHFGLDPIYSLFYYMAVRVTDFGANAACLCHNNRVTVIEFLLDSTHKTYTLNDPTEIYKYQRTTDIGLLQPYCYKELLSSFYASIGNTLEAARWYQMSRMTSVSAEFTSLTAQWNRQRHRLNRDDQGHIRTWFATYATDAEKTRVLQLSADIAGIKLTIGGLGTQYTSLYDKTQALNFLLQNQDLYPFDDNDCIVLIDAYDVLFTPAIARIAEHLPRSPTPIVYSAELGGYPSIRSAWTNRGMRTHWPSDGTTPGRSSRALKREAWDLFPRYLNSGMMMGRVGQVRLMFRSFMKSFSANVYIDDQHLITNYANRHPALISLDYDSRLFFNAYGLAPEDVYFNKYLAIIRRKRQYKGYSLDTNSHRECRGSNSGEYSSTSCVSSAQGPTDDKVLCAAAVHGSGSTGKIVYNRLVTLFLSAWCTEFSASTLDRRGLLRNCSDMNGNSRGVSGDGHSDSTSYADVENRIDDMRKWWIVQCGP